MISLIKNEFIKIKRIKLIFIFLLIIISILLLNKYSKSDLKTVSYNIIPFIGIIECILFSGSICSEIDSGTMRFYLTKPFKRYKVYLSKLISALLFLLISYLVIVIMVSMISGFDISYIKNYFVNCIPLIFMPSFILFLSAKFKNHVFVSTISILILSFGLLASQVFFGIKMNFIEYTFLPYLDFSIFKDNNILNEMNNELGIHLSLSRGIIIDVIYFVIFLISGIIKFNKKDIKI